jgi:hypothetical protein
MSEAVGRNRKGPLQSAISYSAVDRDLFVSAAQYARAIALYALLRLRSMRRGSLSTRLPTSFCARRSSYRCDEAPKPFRGWLETVVMFFRLALLLLVHSLNASAIVRLYSRAAKVRPEQENRSVIDRAAMSNGLDDDDVAIRIQLADDAIVSDAITPKAKFVMP